MEVSHVIEKLHQLRYFESYPEWAVEKAVKQFQKKYREESSGKHAELFQRFPALALQVIQVDGELDGADDLKLVFRQMTNATFKIFAPRSIKVKQVDETLLLQFTHGDAPYSFKMDCEGWLPDSFFDFLRKVMKKECKGLGFHAVHYPDPGQCEFFLLCTSRAYNALTKAELIPKSLESMQPRKSAKKIAAAPLATTKEKPQAPPIFPPPSDVARAERLKLYKNGKWAIPSLSSKTVYDWPSTFNFKVTPNEQSDRWKAIRNAFDLLCASHYGLTGIGKASGYAKLVVELVHQYLFGSWRKRYVEDGKKVTEAKLLKELNCEDEIIIGCICALCMNDKPAMKKFLLFLDHEVDSLTPESTAFYRLLADWILNRSRWDWGKQSRIIQGRNQAKFTLLLNGLLALKNNDAIKLQSSLSELRKRSQQVRPYWFSNLVEPTASLMVILGVERGVHLPNPSLKLNDCLLSRSIISD